MKIFANKDIKNFFLAISVIWTVFLLLAEGFEWLLYQKFSLYLLLLSLLPFLFPPRIRELYVFYVTFF